MSRELKKNQGRTCYEYKESVWERKGLWEYLNIHEASGRQVISFVGGGGKTSIIFSLAEEGAGYFKKKKKILVTTTTKMFLPEKNTELNLDLRQLKFLLEQEGYGVAGRKTGLKKPGEVEKIKGLPDDFLKEAIGLSDFVLIEADGAKGLPLKAPAQWEPVFPGETTKVVGILGIDSLGKPIGETCHRPELVMELLGTSMDHVVTAEDAAAVVSSAMGQRKDLFLLPYMEEEEFYVVINKVDSEALLPAAEQVAKALHRKGIRHIAAAGISMKGRQNHGA